MPKAWLAILFCACGAAQSVDGTVINPVTNAGIAGIRLDLAQGSTTLSVTTDPLGNFHADNLKEGAWTVRFPFTEYSGRPARFTIRNGTPATVELKLAPLPRITGRVVDGSGRPAPNASILLASKSGMYAAPADNSGRFDFHDQLTPGDYVISAAAAPGAKPPDPEPESGRPLGWARTYYPASTLREAAASIPLHPGAEVRDIEIKLLPVPARTIHGVLLQADGSPASKIKVTLGQGRPFPVAQTVETDSDGAFQFSNVIDGEWNVAALSGDLQASEWLDVAGRDVERLKLRLAPPFRVSGRTIIESPPGMAAPAAGALLQPHVSHLALEITAGGARIAAKLEGDGTFTMEKVYAGSYSIQATTLPPPYYIDSIRVDDAEITTREVELRGATNITVTYKTNGGTVRGTLDGCTEGSVWLVPQEPARRYGFYRFAPCLENGRYEIKAVRPGEYYALPLIDDLPRLWLSGIFDQPLLDRTTRVTVRAGETTALDLRQ